MFVAFAMDFTRAWVVSGVVEVVGAGAALALA